MDAKGIKIIYFGTSHFAEIILDKLISEGFEIIAVVTQPDKKAGRKQMYVSSPVKQLSEKYSISVLQPDTFNDEAIIRKLGNMKPDLFVVASYGKILPKAVLGVPRFGCINIHASLLPKYRGASPIQNAILNGEKETGVTLMLMNEKMDQGDIIAQESVDIKKAENTEMLSERLAKVGAELTVRTVPLWTGGKIKAKKQDENLATYCRPIRKEDGRIDWRNSAEEIERRFLAFQIWPGIWTEIKQNSKRLKLLSIKPEGESMGGEDAGKVIKYDQKAAVQTGKGIIILEEVQLEGKKAVPISDFLKGNQNFIGSRIG
ncbi:MAG: methionyl-tRNA formyltransferase [Parcubacteria group bacterium]